MRDKISSASVAFAAVFVALSVAVWGSDARAQQQGGITDPVSPAAVQTSDWQQTFESLSRQLEQISSDLTTEKEAAASIQQELFRRIRFVQQELRELRGLVEAQRREIEKQQRLQNNQYLDLERRLIKLEKAPTQLSLPSAESASRDSSADDSGQDYQRAYNKVLEGKFDEGFTLLRDFLVRWPRSAKTPDALYWLGELYLLRKPPALAEADKVFAQLLKFYPEHQRVPDAMFKIGKIQHLQNKMTQARETLEQVIQDHAASTAGQQAQAYLRQYF